MQNHLQSIEKPKVYSLNLFELLVRYAVEKKDVMLASGQKSTIYLDCRQVYCRGDAQFFLGEIFFEKMLQLEKNGLEFDALGGMAIGALALNCAVASAAFRRGRNLSGFVVRKEAKSHGMESVIEGNKCLFNNARALILEDVVTTGASIMQAVNAIRSAGIIVDTAFAIVDREQGGKELLSKGGIKLYSIFKIAQFLQV